MSLGLVASYGSSSEEESEGEEEVTAPGRFLFKDSTVSTKLQIYKLYRCGIVIEFESSKCIWKKIFVNLLISHLSEMFSKEWINGPFFKSVEQ
jgi:hypothetical protein